MSPSAEVSVSTSPLDDQRITQGACVLSPVFGADPKHSHADERSPIRVYSLVPANLSESTIEVSLRMSEAVDPAEYAALTTMR